MSKKTTHPTEPPPSETEFDPMAEAERQIAEARQENATELDLSGLGLTDVPTALVELRQLKSLNISRNQLQEAPAALGELRQLQKLDLSKNQLREVPASLGKSQQLQELYLSLNQLREVSAVLGELQQLQWLDLSSNQLREIPAFIGKLQELQYLFLYNNQLRELPRALGNWTLAKIRPFSGSSVCSLNNFWQHLPVPDAICNFSSGGACYLFDIEPLLVRRLTA